MIRMTCGVDRWSSVSRDISYRSVIVRAIIQGRWSTKLIYLATYLHYITTFFFGPDPVDRRRSTTLRRARSIVFLFSFMSLSLSLPFPFHHPVCLRAFMSTLHVMINRSFFVANGSFFQVIIVFGLGLRVPQVLQLSKLNCKLRFGMNVRNSSQLDEADCIFVRFAIRAYLLNKKWTATVAGANAARDKDIKQRHAPSYN